MKVINSIGLRPIQILTTGGKHSVVNVTIVAGLSQNQCSGDIALDRLKLMVLTPIDVRTTSPASAIDYVSGFDII